MALSSQDLYPLPVQSRLEQQFLGKDLGDVDCPMAVIDRAVARRNCSNMLDAARTLKLSFRAHVKTHKADIRLDVSHGSSQGRSNKLYTWERHKRHKRHPSTTECLSFELFFACFKLCCLDLTEAGTESTQTVELARLQTGEGPGPVRLVVSTVSEAEHLLPYLEECKASNREVNVLYGIPPSSTCLRRLETLRNKLGPDSISFLADHPDQLKHLVSKGGQYGSSPIPVFVKCDSGYHRAGIPTYGQDFKTLIQTISTSDHVRLVGFYTHSSLSYNASNPEEALQYLETEISCGREAVWIAQRTLPEWKSRHFIVSVGATPSVSSVQNLLSDSERARTTRSQLENVKTEFELELHAGVYSLLDLQQVATHARPAQAGNEDISPTMTTDDIGFRILAEVLSVYNERPKPEALIGAGTLALGREPCKSYPGWAIVAPSPWNSHKGADATGDDDIAGGTRSIYSEDHRTGWIVDRVSQEHGILAWHSEQPVTDGIASPVRLNAQDGLNVGQKLVLWPNHACIAGAGFPFYLVIDSEARANSSRTEIVDVWVRARGW